MRRLRMVSIVLVALVATGWVVLGRVAPRMVGARLSRVTGLEVAIGRVAVGWSTARLVLGDVVARGPDGTAVVRIGSLTVGVLGLGDGGRLDGAVVHDASLLDRPAVDARARRLRIRATDGAITVDGVIEAGEAVVAIADGRFDPTTRAASARRVVMRGVAFETVPMRWPVATDRLVVTAGRVGDVVVDRLVADGIGATETPARLRAELRIASGTVRVRWNGAAPRLDLRLVECPLRALAAGAFPAARLAGGVASGVVHVGRSPGLIESRLRIGPTRLERDGETWLGWEGATLDVRRFEIVSRRLLRGKVAFTGPTLIVRRGVGGTWPIAGWDAWTSPAWRLAASGVWGGVVARFARDPRNDEPGDGGEIAMANGTVTIVDETTAPPARLGVRDLNVRATYARATRSVEAHVDGRVGDGGRIVAALVREPEPRATLAVSHLPVEALGGWSAAGRELLGVPLGRALALAGADPVLDVAVAVTGDPTEKRFGLATKAFEALIETLRDRVTTPLLAAAELRREDGVESLALPVVAVDATASSLTGDAADAADRVAVLLRNFPELSARVEGRFAPDESAVRGEARAAAVARHLGALGFADRIVVGPVAAGPAGVAIVLGGRVS